TTSSFGSAFRSSTLRAHGVWGQTIFFPLSYRRQHHERHEEAEQERDLDHGEVASVCRGGGNALTPSGTSAMKALSALSASSDVIIWARPWVQHPSGPPADERRARSSGRTRLRLR